jgi:hypothetical protein
MQVAYTMCQSKTCCVGLECKLLYCTIPVVHGVQAYSFLPHHEHHLGAVATCTLVSHLCYSGRALVPLVDPSAVEAAFAVGVGGQMGSAAAPKVPFTQRFVTLLISSVTNRARGLRTDHAASSRLSRASLVGSIFLVSVVSVFPAIHCSLLRLLFGERAR